MIDLSSAEIYTTIDTKSLKPISSESLMRYTPPEGQPDLLGYLAKHEHVDISNIVIGPGSKFLFRSIVSAGGDLLIVGPNWPGYEASVADLDIKVHTLDTIQTDLKIDLKILEEYLEQHDSIKYVVISTPNNPTGYIYSEQEIRDIYSLCNKRDILFIVDQAYLGINFTGQEPFNASSLLQEYTKNILVLNSATKTYGMQGVRIGWIVSNKDVCEGVTLAVKDLMICTPPAAQEILLDVLTNPNLINVTLEQLKKKRDLLVEAVNNAKNLELLFIAKGGTTVLAKLPDGIDDEVFVEDLLRDEDIEVDYGKRMYAKGYIRLTYSREENLNFSEVIQKIDKYLERYIVEG